MTALNESNWNLSAARLTLLAALVLLSACSISAKRDQAPLPTLPAQFAGAGETPAPERWWQAFADPELDALVATALTDNPGLQAIEGRLRAADAVARGSGASLIPSLSLSASHSRDVGDQPNAELNRGGLSAAYEIDLWGRLRANRDSAQLQAEATAQELSAARISLSASVASLWFQIGSTAERLQRIEQERAAYERILVLVENRHRYGQAPISDVLRQRQLVESTRSLQASTVADLGIRRHALQELLGQAAGGSAISGRLPLALPAVPRTGVPAATVSRRPDVRQRWLQIEAADRSVAAAIANRFPQLSLSASYTSSDAGAAQLFDNWVGNLIANLLTPLIDGGARRAEVERSRAVLDQRIADYRAAVLTAFREVQDALLQDQQLQVRLTSLEAQLALSDAVVDRLERQLRNGSDSYLGLLDAQISNSSLRRELITTRQLLVEQRIGLFRVMAGPLPDSDIAAAPDLTSRLPHPADRVTEQFASAVWSTP